jgi:tRNA (guanosine-2'-O-)-methyltransferase
MTPERTTRINNVLDCRQPDITILMENIQDPHNISAVMRTCDAIGVTEIFICNHTIPLHKKFGDKSSSSANKWLVINQFDNVKDCVNVIKAKSYKMFATYLHQESKSLYELNLAEPVCLVFGNEKAGVTKEILAHCDGNFIIPQVGMIKSLNISVACAVSLYEAFRQKKLAGHYDNRRLDNVTEAFLTNKWKLTNETE